MAFEDDYPVYSSRSEVESLISNVGINLRIDDDDDGVISIPQEEDLLDDCIAEATDTFNLYAMHYYDPEYLAGSRWVRRRVSYMAAHILGRRRGNTSIYCSEWERIMEELGKVGQGLAFIPLLPRREDFIPMVSNTVIDRNYTKKKQRVDKSQSVGDTTDIEQDEDYLGQSGGYGRW